jgi:L-malate glycosyltransferase
MSKQKLKICLLCDARSIHYQRWIRDLKNAGHDVFVFSPWEEKSENNHIEFVSTPKAPFPIFPVVRLSLKMMYRIKLARRVRKSLQTMKPDIVHAHFLTDSGWIGAWTKFSPFIVTAHGSDVLIHPVESTIYRRAVKFVLKRAHKVVIVAEHLTDNLLKFGCQREKISWIPNYVEQEFFISPAEIENKFGDVRVAPKILSARKLDPIYNVETLIRAAAIVIKKYPQAEFRIIDNGQELDKLKDLTQELKIQPNVIFIGRVQHEALADYFKKSHIYVSTALSDGLSVTTLEGMASGMYPIITDIPANKRLVTDNENGALFPCKQPEQLAKQILKSIEDSSVMITSCKKNLEYIRQHFSKASVVERMETVYFDTIASWQK